MYGRKPTGRFRRRNSAAVRRILPRARGRSRWASACNSSAIRHCPWPLVRNGRALRTQARSIVRAAGGRRDRTLSKQLAGEKSELLFDVDDEGKTARKKRNGNWPNGVRRPARLESLHAWRTFLGAPTGIGDTPGMAGNPFSRNSTDNNPRGRILRSSHKNGNPNAASRRSPHE